MMAGEGLDELRNKRSRHTELLIDFLEAWALIDATIETTVGFLVVAKV
jgi:hypothetical protein